MILNRLVQGVVDLFYPEFPKCPACKSSFVPDEIFLCERCIKEINFIRDDYCFKCGKLIFEEDLCADCQSREHYFSEARAVGIYEAGLKEYIKLFKYHKIKSLQHPLSQLLSIYTYRFYNLRELDLVTYIPIHQERLEERGFNQARLLAMNLGVELGLTVKPLLVRTVNTVAQSKLSRVERLKNLEGKVKIDDARLVKGQRILLVDDIYTTGATVDEASKVLIAKGAQDVKVITLATGKKLEDKNRNL